MRALLLLAVMSLPGCGSPTLGDLETPSVTIVVRGVATQSGVAAVGEPQGGLGISRAFVSMSSLTLMPCREGAREIILSGRGYDLLSDPPNAEIISTAVTELCGLRFDIDPLEQNVTEGVPEEAALFVQGTDAAGTPFELASDRSLSLLLEAGDGYSFGQLPLLFTFDLSLWLAAIPMGEGLEELGLEAFEAQAAPSVALYVDSNENYALDADEQTPVARSTP